MFVHGRNLNYYVVELETEDGPQRFELYFDAGRLIVRSERMKFSIKLTRANAIAITYTLSKYVERVLSEDEIRALLR